MLPSRTNTIPGSAILLAVLLLIACGGDETSREASNAPPDHPLLGASDEAAIDGAGTLPDDLPAALRERVAAMAAAAAGTVPTTALTVDYPLDGSVFPPEFVPPTFLWHDADDRANAWLVEIAFSDSGAKPVTALVRGAPPPKGMIDLEAIAETNELYEGTEYDRSARSWTPTGPLWEEMKRRSHGSTASLTFTGFTSSDLTAPLSRGTVRIETSTDPVTAPIFYRDVPLMAAVSQHGKIQPLGPKAIPIIAWRLRDVSRPESKLVLKGMPSCGNCHSFSLDGKTMGMDVDGPDGDKGMYAVKPITKDMVITEKDVITWNSFPGKPKEHRTIGFASRVSPDGRFVASTVNEALYVSNFPNYKFLQVFYPTRGIIAVHSREDGTIRALPGADDPEYVHCSPVWSPDGEFLIFSRAKAFDPYTEGQPIAKYPNDPNEPQVRYDLYRIPFNDGAGGTAEPVEGASGNGMSNTFPKVSPDGEWIVYTQCKNGLLMRPDSRLRIVPFEGGESRDMKCNTDLMNSWHSFSPNGRWLVFSSKSRRPYTQAFLTHIDEDGNDTPAILVPNCTADNRAVNLPEFLNAPYGALDTIAVPVVRHQAHALAAQRLIEAGDFEEAAARLEQAIATEPTFVRALISLGYALMQLGRAETAIQHFETARLQAPRDPFVLNNLGISYMETGRPYMALAAFEKLVAVAPGFPVAKQRLDGAREAAERLSREIESLEKETARSRADSAQHLRLADLYRRAGCLEEAVRQMDRAIELSPRDPICAANLAWVLSTNPDASIRDGARAVELARRAVEGSGGKRPEPLYILAAALGEAGRHEEAVKAAEQALALARDISAPMAVEIEARLERHRKGLPIRSAPDR